MKWNRWLFGYSDDSVSDYVEVYLILQLFNLSFLMEQPHQPSILSNFEYSWILPSQLLFRKHLNFRADLLNQSARKNSSSMQSKN